jgi:hypothetical protein
VEGLLELRKNFYYCCDYKRKPFIIERVNYCLWWEPKAFMIEKKTLTAGRRMKLVLGG